MLNGSARRRQLCFVTNGCENQRRSIRGYIECRVDIRIEEFKYRAFDDKCGAISMTCKRF